MSKRRQYTQCGFLTFSVKLFLSLFVTCSRLYSEVCLNFVFGKKIFYEMPTSSVRSGFKLRRCDMRSTTVFCRDAQTSLDKLFVVQEAA